MKQSERSHEIFIAFGLMLVAAVLRIYGIGWGLPQVYEEATPLYKAWEMWGWGAGERLDLNPHFFNYPSFSIYLQFLGQGLLYVGLKILGTVDSALDFRVLYVLDKTSFYIMGRAITVLFGVLTVWLMYSILRTVTGRAASAAAALFLAVAPFHISKSQVIEVDVPVTCLAMLTLWFAVRLLGDPSRKNYISAGLAMGLSISMKYTAAFLIFPLLAAHILAVRVFPRKPGVNARRKSSRPVWSSFFMALGLALVAFALTSPFVFLDTTAFLKDFSFERTHMRLGHFGLDATSSWYFYLQSLANKMMGWPLFLLAVAGFIYLGVIKRRGWALVLIAFFVPFLVAVASWAMRADRYVLPMLPVFLLLAGGMLAEIASSKKLSRIPRTWRPAVAAAAIVLLLVPLIAAFPDHLSRLKTDTRTRAKEWVETNIPPGSLILEEHYGPDLFSAKELSKLPSDVRKVILTRKTDAKLYAVQTLPLLHIAENSGVYYDLTLYEDADYVITSNGVRSRYLKDPSRFPAHIAFYNDLEKNFQLVREFRPEDGPGPIVSVYKNPHQSIPFSARRTVRGPAELEASPDKAYRGEEFFLENLGFNYQTFKYYREALTCFEMAFRFQIVQPSIRTNLTLGRTQCLLALGRREEAVQLLERAAAAASDRAERDRFNRLRSRILSGG